MEGQAMFNYNGSAEDELSFQAGNILKIISFQEDRNWFKAELDGRIGFVPKNYIQMKDNYWYMGGMTRQEAERFLLRTDTNLGLSDGSFIVRDSESNPNSFALSVRWFNTQDNRPAVQHYRILRNNESKYLLWIVQFNSINELVNYHKTTSVARTQQLLLRDTVKRQSLRSVRAVHRFQPDEPGEIGFEKNDDILVLDDSDEQWWRGRTTRDENFNIGIFPKNYVQ